MRVQQLRLVQREPVTMQQFEESTDPVQRVFADWLFLFGKSPARCKLGPTRRAAISAALVLYDEALLQQALVGAAADEWLAQQSGLGVEWILANEARIERFADVGLRVQARAERAVQQGQPLQTVDAAPTDEQRAQAAQARERMRDLARRLSGRGADE